MTTPTEAERVAMGLTKAAKRALLECTPWDVEVSVGVAIAFCANGLLEDSTIVDDGVQLSDLGLQVRAALSQEDV
jgi:hypothetical protein